MASPLVRERLRQLRNAALARGVARHGDAALEGQHRRDEDDLPASLSDHAPAELPREHELRREVDLEHAIPEVVSVLDGGSSLDRPRVQDEDVEAREVGRDRRGELVHRLPFSQIAAVRTKAPTQPR